MIPDRPGGHAPALTLSVQAEAVEELYDAAAWCEDRRKPLYWSARVP